MIITVKNWDENETSWNGLNVLNFTKKQGFYELEVEDNEENKEETASTEYNKKEKALKELQKLCDTKTKQAKTYIAGQDVTQEQLERWEEKYNIAKEYLENGNYIELLQLEADLKGISIEQLANLIIQIGDAYKQALLTFNARIEAFRIKVKELIKNGDVDKALSIIKRAWSLGASATDEDIKNLFKD